MARGRLKPQHEDEGPRVSCPYCKGYKLEKMREKHFVIDDDQRELVHKELFEVDMFKCLSCRRVFFI